MIKIKRTTGDDQDFVALTKQLDVELSALYQTNSADFAGYNQLSDLQTVVIVYVDENATGCGCFRDYAPGVAELKRMYVATDMRGKGIALLILEEMETWAKESGIKELILETGERQPGAIALYHKCGYAQIDNYDQYKGVASSICMKKSLT